MSEGEQQPSEAAAQTIAYLRWCVKEQENIINGLREQLYAHTGDQHRHPVHPPANILRDKTNTP